MSTLQPLDFEIKPSYTLKVEGANTHPDPAFRQRGPFKDVTIVHVSVEDVDEPPLFDLPAYYIELPEDAEIGTLVRTLSARDPDAANNTVRWGNTMKEPCPGSTCLSEKQTGKNTMTK